MNKKGQEELIGFVAVVVLVMIIGVIYLGFTLRTGERSVSDSLEVKHFLQSSFEYTSSCSLGASGSYVPLGRLLELCRAGDSCAQGLSCDMLNQTLSLLIKEGLKPNPNSPIEGLSFEAYYVQNTTSGGTRTAFFRLDQGTCGNSTLRGASEIYPSSEGFIRAELSVCP